MTKLASVLYSVGLAISALVGALHFVAPYAFAWYSYIPGAPRELTASIDYVNFFFSFLLTGLSILLLVFKRRAFAFSTEVLAFHALLVATWLARIVVTLVVPPNDAQLSWLVTGFSAQFAIMLVSAVHLWHGRRVRRPAASVR